MKKLKAHFSAILGVSSLIVNNNQNYMEKGKQGTRSSVGYTKKTFDNGYRNKKYHSDYVKSKRPILFNTAGVPSNPFTVISKKKKNKHQIPRNLLVPR